MKNSDVFNSFVKIAKEKGLISEDSPTKGKSLTEKDFKEPNPRWDSLTIEQISKLYNTKPPVPKGTQELKNIIEQAHPDLLVIAPSYDKLNGLIPNENQGQNIRMHITMKQPDGHLLQRKYAEKQLILSLIRTANDLDNTNQEDLRVLADTCLEQVAKKVLTKKAFLPAKKAFLPAVGAIAAAIGVLYAKQHLRFHSDGFEADYQKADAEISDLLNSNSNFFAGYSYTPAFLQIVSKLKDNLNLLHDAVQKTMPILDNMDTPRDGKELSDLAQQPKTQEAAQALSELQAVIHQVYPEIDGVISSFSNPMFKQRAIADKGFLTSLVDSAEVLHGGSGLISDDFDDVAHALQTIKVDISAIVKALQSAQGITEKANQQIQSVESESQEMFNPQEAPQSAPEESDQKDPSILEKMMGFDT